MAIATATHSPAVPERQPMSPIEHAIYVDYKVRIRLLYLDEPRFQVVVDDDIVAVAFLKPTRKNGFTCACGVPKLCVSIPFTKTVLVVDHHILNWNHQPNAHDAV